MRQVSLTFYSLYPHTEVHASCSLLSTSLYLSTYLTILLPSTVYLYTDKKENKIFIIYKEI
jgi:hypothetical protein